jgi:hypothetical protein
VVEDLGAGRRNERKRGDEVRRLKAKDIMSTPVIAVRWDGIVSRADVIALFDTRLVDIDGVSAVDTSRLSVREEWS